MKDSKWVNIGFCAVDSGQLVLVDPCYIMPQDKRTLDDDQLDYNQLFDIRYGKGDPAEQAQEIIFSGIAGNGVVFDSGIGDGNYPVYAKFVDDPDMGRRIAEVKVVMLPHPYFK